MNLYRQLLSQNSEGKSIRVGLIGAGKFGTMYLSQAKHTPGVSITAVVDKIPSKAEKALDHYGASKAHITDDPFEVIQNPDIDVIIDATGSPTAGISHVLDCCEYNKNIIMVNVEADALAGPILAKKANKAGIIYSLAYGDQPALICEQVDWARTSGFDVIAGGKGTKYLDGFHEVTPDDVWEHYGLTSEQAEMGGLNAKMFNSFLDGTKSAIEMAAVSNATGLSPAPEGLKFPPVGVNDLPNFLKPESEGGMLHHKGQVEVVSSQKRDGKDVLGDLRWGVYVVLEATSDYVSRCFKEYGLITDKSGCYTAMWKPYHLIGMELGISVASVSLRNEPTGSPTEFIGDAVAIAKRNLQEGEILDGEGGYTVYGKLMPSVDSLANKCLPIGLAQGIALNTDVHAGSPITWDQVNIDLTSQAVKLRREMESLVA
ncbi:MAG: flagellar biosynthesis protein FlgA [Alphaproteobacteria bacterium]|nr:flagellar biosynthesis protein FlgA [Alphaproteobacteria bacterium]PPR12773.1 MAG: Inositol 2-dehydrogenase/D-chiro-inositol 3-dehydrogenase [Alphaproteobacteria bacterium MarineAlpha12_Bin1]|tara:strand:+ start:2337 stop:3626 length:1290 start_codon:yes stop_codon:yes gene_type:complete